MDTCVASQAELQALRNNPTLKSLYLPDEANCVLAEGDSDKREKIGSPFYREFFKVMWHSPNLTTLEPKNSQSITNPANKRQQVVTSYYINTISKNLTQLRFRYRYPELRVKKEHEKSFRIGWTHELGPNSCISAVMYVGDLLIEKFESPWIVDYYKWGSDPAMQEVIDRSLCNVKEMTNMTTHIKENHCDYMLPFPFSYSAMSSFPLYLLPQDVKVRFDITYYADVVSNLLRIEMTEDGNKWNPIVPDAVTIASILTQGDVHRTPIIKADWTFMTPEAVADDAKREIMVLPMHSVTTFTEDNTTEPGKTSVVKISSKDPFVAMFWRAIDVDQELFNNFSVCTMENGKSSISKASMVYGMEKKFEVDDEDMMSICQNHHFPNIPREPGYFAAAFTHRPFNPVLMSGCYLDPSLDASLRNDIREVKMNSDDSKEEEILLQDITPKDVMAYALSKTQSVKEKRRFEETKRHSRFKVIVNGLVHRDLAFTRGPDGLTFNVSISK